MIKRTLLAVPALLLCLAFATSSHAGSVVTGTLEFSSNNPTTTKIDSITATIGGGGTLSNASVVVVSSTPAGLSPMVTTSGDTFTVTFTANTYTAASFTYSVDASGSISAISAGSATVSLTITGPGTSGKGISETVSSVPEPSSFALLGVGISGFIAFRRRFARKLPVA